MSDLPPLDWCLGGYCLLTLACVGAVSFKYRSIFHPLLFPGLQLFVQTGLAPWAQDVGHSMRLQQTWWLGASLLTALFLFGLTWPMLTPLNPLLPVCEVVLGPLEFSRRRMNQGADTPRSRGNSRLLTGETSRRTPRLLCGLYAGFLSILAMACFALLVRDSSVGTLWITDPRLAYMSGRAGSGHWYVLSQTCLFLSYLCWLYYLRPRNRVVLLCGTLACVTVMSYFGSKAAMVGVIVAGGVYFNYFVRTFTWGEVALAAGMGVPVVLISPWLQGNFDSLKETLQYYDYFDNAARYVGRHDHFGPQYGGALLSSLWEYVPRRLVPEKPYVYGILIVNEYFFEGAAKVGYTPGHLPWIPYHIDFGIPGVFVGACLLGFLNKAIYTYFLRYRSFLGFLCFLQVAFIPVLKLAPVLYFVALLLGLAISLRLFLAGGMIVLGTGVDQGFPTHASMPCKVWRVHGFTLPRVVPNWRDSD